MRAIHKEMAISISAGALVAYLWSHYVGYVFNFLFTSLGSPEGSIYLGKLLICITSFFFGALVILPCLFKAASIGQIGAIATVTTMFSTVLLLNTLVSNFSIAIGQLSSYGFWSFILGGILALSIRVPNAT